MEKLFDLARRQAESRPGSIMLAAKNQGIWQTYSCKEVLRQANAFADGLLTLGIRNQVLEPEQQEKITLVAPNRPEWVIADLAVQQTGAILTPIYPTISPAEFAFILNEAEVRIAIFADREMLNRFKPVFEKIPTLKHIITFDEVEGYTHWKGLKGTAKEERMRLEMTSLIKPETVATIIYTSGTTGRPKGVMLTHANIASNVLDCMPIFHFAKIDDRVLSFLPLNHIFEKMLTYIYIHAGLSIYYAESMDTIGDNLREVKPMVFTCVPRLLEKVYEKIHSKGMALNGIKRTLFFWALNLGRQYDTVNKGSLFYRWQLALANRLVFDKWRAALGGRVKAVVSGSAALQERLIRIFCAAGIPVMEGYGLTETSPVISVNRLEESERRIGTVGAAIRNVQIRIADDGEIICRGPNVMLGYYKNPAQTAEVLDADGWLHTGDIGVLIDNKYLKITDRKKEMFKTSGGKYVAPQAIENKMRESPLIEQMMVIGPGRKFVTALIVPNFSNLRLRLKSSYPNLPEDNRDLIRNEEVIRLIQEQIAHYNPLFSHVEQVKKFSLLPQEWTIDNGILTPKLSLKRKVVYEKYATEIEAMYDGAGEEV
jgi:long-chain acyl-CoA synthetase